MQFIEWVALLSRWAHILCVVIAVGGAVFSRFVLLPAAEESLSVEDHGRLRAAAMGRWRKIVHACIVLLLLSGGFNFYLALRDKVPPMPYHALFGVKFLLALVVFFLASALAGSKPGFAALRARGKKWLGVLVGSAVVVILLSGVLRALHQGALASASP
jgi:uncharacterized membrane protein